MCHKKKTILFVCILAVLVTGGVLLYCLMASRQKPESLDGTFVHAFHQSMERWGL